MTRLRRNLIRGLIALGTLVAILLIVNAILISVYSGQVEDRIEAIRAAGDPVSLADLAPKQAPPTEQNAAVFLSRAKDHLDNISKELQPIYVTRDFAEGRLNKSDVVAIDAALAAYPDVI